MTKHYRQIEGSALKLRQIGVLIQTNFAAEGNSVVTDMLGSLDNGPHPGMSEQTDGIKPAGQGESVNTQHRDHMVQPTLILIKNP